jgi:NADH:ubiquinone oxidoreductase subunit E
MKNRITKNVKDELKNILNNTGYWSNETREYIEQFNDTSRLKLHSMAQAYDKYKMGL